MWTCYTAGEEWKTNEKSLGCVTSTASSEDHIYSFSIFIFWIFNFNISFALEVYFDGFDALLNVTLSFQICEKENVAYYVQV